MELVEQKSDYMTIREVFLQPKNRLQMPLSLIGAIVF